MDLLALSAASSAASSTRLSLFVLASTALAALALIHAIVTCVRIVRRTRNLQADLARAEQLQAQLEAARAAIAARADERAAALAKQNEELLQQRLLLEAANRRLQRLVAVDSLTGVANRRCFDRALERELRRTRRDGAPLSLVFIDLDGFKRFNDTYGHARGDDVLRQAAQTLDETFRRGGDLVARYGGEEFAIILPGVDARRAELYAERLRRRVWRLAIPFRDAPINERVTISCGVATALAAQRARPEELLAAADEALYRAKRLGRNRVATAAVDTPLPQQIGAAS